MLKLFVLACCFVAVSQGEAEAQFGGYYPHFPVSYPFSFPHYPFHPTSSSNQYVGEGNQKTFGLLGGVLGGLALGNLAGWGRPFVFSTTVFSTSTVTFTCTKSTTSTCAGRRRRDLLGDRKSGIESEQFDISPSKTVAIEPTVSVDSVQREAREADPHYYAGGQQHGRSYYYPSFYEHTNGYHNVNNLNPGVSVVVDSNSDDEPAVTGALNRDFFFNNRRVTTVTFTSLVITATTSTSTPTCSAPGTFAQCPQITAG